MHSHIHPLQREVPPMSKSKLSLLAFVLVATISQAQAGAFTPLTVISTAPQVSRTPGLLDVQVTFNVPCGITFVGLETSITNLDPPRTVAGNNFVSKRQISVRAIGEDTGRRCLAADTRMTATFQAANAGAAVTFR